MGAGEVDRTKRGRTRGSKRLPRATRRYRDTLSRVAISSSKSSSRRQHTIRLTNRLVSALQDLLSRVRLLFNSFSLTTRRKKRLPHLHRNAVSDRQPYEHVANPRAKHLLSNILGNDTHAHDEGAHLRSHLQSNVRSHIQPDVPAHWATVSYRHAVFRE